MLRRILSAGLAAALLFTVTPVAVARTISAGEDSVCAQSEAFDEALPSPRQMYEKLRDLNDSSVKSCFSEYPFDSNGAFDYYSEAYGERFYEQLETLYKACRSIHSKKTGSAVGAAAQESTGAVSWSISGNTLTVSGTGAMPDYDSWDNIPPWSEEHDEVTRIVVGEGITSIGSNSFEYLWNVETVVLPSTLTAIGKNAFTSCRSLSAVNFPSGLREIDSDAFSYSALTSVTLPESVERVGESAFMGCESLSYVYLGSKLRVLGGNPFGACESLKEFHLSSGNDHLYLNNATIFDKDGTLLAYPAGRQISTYTVPSGVRSIATDAFRGDYDTVVQSVVIPDSVISIGDGAFENAGLSSVTFGSGLEEIGRYAFFNNKKLSYVSLPASLTCIGEEAFSLTDLASIYIPQNVKSIGRAVFSCADSLSNISVDSSNQYYKSVGGVLYSKDGTVLHTYPAGKTNTSFTVPGTVIELEEKAFEFLDNLKTVTLPEGLRSIGWGNFSNCNAIESITIPDSTVTLGGYSFINMESLKTIVIGKGIACLHEVINGFDFYPLDSCDNLAKVYFRGNLPQDHSEMLFKYDTSVPVTVYYPRNNPTWKNGSVSLGYSYLKLEPWAVDVSDLESLKNASLSLSAYSYTYDGTSRKPDVTVTLSGERLVEGKDYRVKYENCRNAGEAKAVVTGINNYTDSVSKTYTIRKADQVLSASLSLQSVKVGGTARINASGVGAISYQSLKPAVAKVSASGVVTGVSAGSADIIVSAVGDGNYNSGTTKLVVTVSNVSKQLTLNDLTYSFRNSSSSFGYPNSYKVPYERYLMFYTPTQAKQRYNNAGTWGGSCAGFVDSTVLFNNDDVDLSVGWFNSSASKVSDLKVKDKSSRMGITVQQLLESLLVCQNVEPAGSFKSSHYGDYNGFVSEVKKCEYGGLPVYVSVRDRVGGHALAAYRFEAVDSTKDHIHVYDCNRPFEDMYIILYKNGSDYTGYYFNDGDEFKSQLSYIPGDLIVQMWDRRLTDNISNDSLMSINSDNFTVYDTAGNAVAGMADGEFTSLKSDIYEVLADDGEYVSHQINLPAAGYTVKSADDSYETPLEIAVVHQNQSAKIKTESDEVTILVDDAQNTNLIGVNGESGEKYEITLNGDNDYTVGKEAVVYSGKSEGKTVEVGTVDGAYINKDYTRGALREDDVAVNLPNSSHLSIEKYSVNLMQSRYNFTGEAVEPVFSILDGTGDALSPNKDFKAVFTNNINKGTAHAEIFGVNDYFGKLEFDFTISAVAIAGCDVTLAYTAAEVTGEELEPAVSVRLAGVALKENEHFTVSYQNNIEAGLATVSITGINGITGTVQKSFTITPDPHYRAGDVNGDGVITIDDATMLQRHLAEFTDINGDPIIDESDSKVFKAADVNADGRITIYDVTAIQRKIAEL